MQPASASKRQSATGTASKGFAMDSQISLPVILSFVTLCIVLAIGIYQFMRVRKSQAKRGEHPGGIAGPE